VLGALLRAARREGEDVVKENAQDKGRRLLTEGRLLIVSVVEHGKIHAKCRGDSGEVYDLGFDPRGNGRWGCTCPAKGKCSHLVALQLVTARPR
jgi:uncharacterized Zn finger protein